MNEVTHTWGYLLTQRNTQAFIGRENILEHFRLNCLDTVPRDLIFVIQGVAGIGKSATITRLREIADRYNIFSTYVDGSGATPDQEKAILRLMLRIAQQFSDNGTPLTQFIELYQEYINTLQKISDDPDAPGCFYDAIGGMNDRDTWHRQTWRTYLHDKFSASVCDLLYQPIEKLTKIFIHDLNTWALVKRILLCFDDWQLLDAQAGAWLRAIMLDGHLSSKIRVILGTSETLTLGWEKLRPLLKLHKMTEFSESEIQAYCYRHEITDRERIADIVAFSNGLPVLVTLLSSAQQGMAGDLALSPLDRYFKWLSPAQGRVVLLASVPRHVNAQLLNTVLGKDGELWFEWLKNANLLYINGDVWVYHPALRPQFLARTRREMYEQAYAAHIALRAHYLLNEYEKESAQPDDLNTALLESVYHGLMIGESGAIRNAVLTYLKFIRSDYTIAGELVETWKEVAKVQENPNAGLEWLMSLENLWNTLYSGDWQTAALICESILKREALDAEVKNAFELLYTTYTSAIS